MPNTVFTLPRFIQADYLKSFVGSFNSVGSASEILVDFRELRRITPAGICALVAQVDGWKRHGKIVQFVGLEHCSITDYLQRMDVFSVCGFPRKETFARHSSRGRFVPVQKIGLDVSQLGTEMALCIAPGGEDYGHPLAGLFDLIWYVLTEIANNVRQHSRGVGYAAAQFGISEGWVRIAIADNGKGVRQSFVDAGFPWSKDLDDIGAIQKALEARVSSKGSPTNEGVGLTLSAELARLVEGSLLICSGTGWVSQDRSGRIIEETLPNGGRFDGTIVAMTVRHRTFTDFSMLMDRAKHEAGLLQRRANQGRFAP